MKNHKMIDTQLDCIYKKIDDLMWSGDFDEIDIILENVPEDACLDLLLGYLTATLPVKKKLKKRDDFFKRVENFCSAMPDADRMLYGLK